MSSYYSPDQLRRIVSKTFTGIFAHYFEKLLLAYYGHQKIKRFVRANVSIQGLEKIERHLSHGRGIILVTGHFGAVEFFPAIFPQLGYAMSMMVHFNSPRLKEVLSSLARKEGVGVIDCGQQNVLFNALQALKRNEIMITECDESDVWDRSGKKTLKILGHRMYLDRGIDLIHLRSKAPVLTAFIRRTGFFKYQMEIHDLDDFEATRGVDSIQGKLLKVFEDYVVRYPDQWYEWKKFHKMIIMEEPQITLKKEKYENFRPENLSYPSTI